MIKRGCIMAENDKRQQKTFRQGRKQLSRPPSCFAQLPLVAAMHVTFYSDIAALIKNYRVPARAWTLAMTDQSVMTSVSNLEKVKVLPCKTNKSHQDKVLNCPKGHGLERQYF